MVASGRARPRGLAPGQRSSKETQRWQAVGYAVSDLTGLGIESQTLRTDSEIFQHYAIIARFFEKFYLNIKN